MGSLDDFLKEEGIYDECVILATKAIVAEYKQTLNDKNELLRWIDAKLSPALVPDNCNEDDFPRLYNNLVLIMLAIKDAIWDEFNDSGTSETRVTNLTLEQVKSELMLNGIDVRPIRKLVDCLLARERERLEEEPSISITGGNE